MAKPDNLEAYEHIAHAIKTRVDVTPNGTVFIHGSDISGIRVSVEAKKETQAVEVCTITLCNPTLAIHDPKARRSIELLNPRATYLSEEVISLSDEGKNGFIIGPNAVAVISRAPSDPAEKSEPALITAK